MHETKTGEKNIIRNEFTMRKREKNRQRNVNKINTIQATPVRPIYNTGNTITVRQEQRVKTTIGGQRPHYGSTQACREKSTGSLLV